MRGIRFDLISIIGIAVIGVFMHDTIERGTEISDAQRLIAGGAIRKAFGLEPIDLRLGLDIARNQLRSGNAGSAFRIYATLVVSDPSDPELQVGLANCALHVGENNLALQAASAIVALTASDPRGYYFSGRACLALGHIAEAKEDLTKAIELARNSSKDALIFDEARKLLERLAVLAK
jgi:Flp pilus assembly protein TadD